MRKDYSYVWQKFHGAVCCLVGTSSMKQRLIAAYKTLATLPEKEIAEELRAEFIEIMNFVRPNEEKGKIEIAVNRATEIEAGDMAGKILGMYDKITRQMGKP